MDVLQRAELGLRKRKTDAQRKRGRGRHRGSNPEM